MKAVTYPIRKVLRVMRRYAAVAFCVAACLFEYLINALTGKTSLLDRASVLHRRSAQLLPRLGITFGSEGTLPADGLLVSNHLSYLDILVYSAIAPCAFVAKREVRSWPGIGWVATLAGSIYVDRSRPGDTHSVQPEMAAAFADGVCVLLFPEGTSSDGRQVLPFRSSLFQPAVESHIPISAACISYEIEDGEPAMDVHYHGDMVLGSHATRLFGKGGIKATVQFGSSARVFSDRKDAARELYEEVSALKDQSATATSRGAAAPV